MGVTGLFAHARGQSLGSKMQTQTPTEKFQARRLKQRLIDQFDVSVTHVPEPLKTQLKGAYVTGLNHMEDALAVKLERKT